MYLAGPYLLGFLFSGGSLALPSLLHSVNFLFFLTIANLYLYGVNDYFDRETDALNPKKGSKEHLLKDAELKQLRFLLILTAIISVLLLAAQPNRVSQLLFALYLFLATFYSAPPLRFKAKPFLDSASNILYALPGFLAYAVAVARFPSMEVVLLGLCWTASMHLFSAIPDIHADKQAKLTTTAVLLGYRGSLFLCFLLWGCFSFFVLTSNWTYPFSLLSLIYPVIPLLVFFFKQDISRVYWYFPFINAFLGFCAFLTFMF